MSHSVTFILSTGRVGSIFLAKQLSKHPELIVRRGPHYRKESFRYLQWCNKAFNRSKIRQYLPLSLWYQWRLILSRWSLTHKRSCRYVEVNNYIFPFLPEIRKAFPKGRVIHIIRDPRKFIASALNRGWCLNRNDLRMKAFHTGEMPKRQWKKLSGVQQLAWYWMRTNEIILNAKPEATVTFESIFSDNHEGFAKILDIIDVSHDILNQIQFDTKTNETRNFYVPKWNKWKPEWRESCRPYFQEAERLFKVTRFYPDLLD